MKNPRFPRGVSNTVCVLNHSAVLCVLPRTQLFYHETANCIQVSVRCTERRTNCFAVEHQESETKMSYQERITVLPLTASTDITGNGDEWNDKYRPLAPSADVWKVGILKLNQRETAK